MSDREGQAKVLRSKVEQVEREKRDLQMRISQSSQGGMAAFQAQELQRQLDIARQNLAHKEQEVPSQADAMGSASQFSRKLNMSPFVLTVLIQHKRVSDNVFHHIVK